MNKHALKLFLASAAVVAAASAQAEPTRLFSQETADVTKELSLDMDYSFISSGFNGALRFGAFGGEVLINSKNALDLASSGFVQPNVGFKMGVARNVAAYGFFSYSKEKPAGGAPSPDADVNFAIGAVYTHRMGNNVLLNAAAELVTDDNANNFRSASASGDNTLFIKLGGAYTFGDRKHGKMSAIGEVILEDSDVLDTTLNLGLRWELRRNVTMDLVFLNDRGSKGGSSTGFPGAIKLNWAF
jgi:hypothetical protein